MDIDKLGLGPRASTPPQDNLEIAEGGWQLRDRTWEHYLAFTPLNILMWLQEPQRALLAIQRCPSHLYRHSETWR